MNVEERRLRTFQNWPANAAVDPQRIAKAGFYYTGRDLEVQCFCCGGRIEDWNYGDQVMARHRRLSPGCPFVNNPASSGNVPICGAPRDSTVPSTVGSSVSTQSSPSSSSGASSLPASLLTLGLFDQTTQFRSEAARLSTFENWPVGHIVTPEQLAKAGFYYQGSGDKVKCAFCSGVVGYWEDGDEPEKEHRRHFPQCPFLYNIPVGNIPISAESGEPCSRLGVRDAQTDNTDPKLAMKELGIQSHHGPRNPKYATVESRLRTYSDWPSGVTQKPDDLAAAGFYYSGTGDQVRCFHCDGGLRLWDPSDDPWMEHARWFNSCGYVTLVKGEQFVKQAVVHHTPPSVPSVPSMLDTGAPLSAQKKIQAHKHPVTERDLQALMCTEPVIAALGTGLDMSRIKMALRQKLEETGLPFTSPDALIEAALECQHEEVAAQDTRLDTETTSLPRIHHWRQRGQSDVEIDDENSWETETEEEDDNGTAQHVMRGQQQQQQQHATNTQQNTILQRNDRQASPLQGSPQCAMSQSMPSLLQTDTSLATTQNENAPEKSGPSYISCRQSLPVLPSMAEDRFQKGSKVSLEEENRRLKEARQCKICMDSEACVVFLPCGHLVTCVNCAPSLSDCPICRQPIKATVRTFLS